MTPDGSDFHHSHSHGGPAGDATQDPAVLPLARAILLEGGRALALFEGAAGEPPATGRLTAPGRALAWSGLGWPHAGGWAGVAVLDGVPAEGDELLGPTACWRVAATPALDIAPAPLAALVRATGGSAPAVLRFLTAALAGHPGGAAFLAGFVAAVAEPDGFVEIVARPTTGGLFAQGWSMSLDPGAARLVTADVAAEVHVATFARDDILPPGRGFCLYGKALADDAGSTLDALHHEKDGRLLRLDVVRGAQVQLEDAAMRHVASMLPRLDAPREVLGAFRRICRPRFAGADTLSGTGLPVAAALDSLLRAPDGALLATGWLLDPLHRVERALLKSTANLYARLDASWCPLARPDLVSGFGADPRFAGLLDPRDAMNGFIAHVPADPAGLATSAGEAELYLELVLDDGSCLFRPLHFTAFESGERLPQLLGALPQAEPEITRIVEDHLAPFLASVPPVSPRPPRGAANQPFALGRPGSGPRDTVAVIPFRSWSELQPMLALLAGTPEAGALELSLVTSRATAADSAARIDEAFAFYGLAGRLVVVPEHDGAPVRLDAGAAASTAPWVLSWAPAALPKQPGWLAGLRAEAECLPGGGLVSPALTYEDGSIAFGGLRSDTAGGCGLAGFGAARLPRGEVRSAPAGAAAIALIDRASLARAGGFAGRLFGETHAHVDLAARLRRQGAGTWCSGAVEFWVLEDQGPDPDSRLVRRIDEALLAARAETDA
ncbi:MAG: hypothetical protein QM699_04560 [Amaricoccus sp.]|uniref:hypothetical protein n=1 Tax=Amaricoccus sp. TaxID=1872485 RepID=UPI0039E3B582